MVDLTNQIERILKTENERGRFHVLNDTYSISLISEIIQEYEEEYHLEPSLVSYDEVPKAEFIYLAAPTGAGKDSLVRRLQVQNPEKNYVELNMDKFRHNFREFIDVSTLRDRTFAEATNDLSFEIFYVMQRILLDYYPGTNIIFTGTLREVDWIEEMIREYKITSNTDYDITLMSLAVPKKDSEFSIISRYLGDVNKYALGKDEKGKLLFLPGFIPGSIRYTNLGYANESYDRFPDNYRELKERLGNVKEVVHTRGSSANDYSENTEVYSSDNPEYADKTAIEVIEELRNAKAKVTEEDLYEVMELLASNKNRPYLQSQKVLMEILHDICDIFGRQEEFAKKVQEIENRKFAPPPPPSEPGDD